MLSLLRAVIMGAVAASGLSAGLIAAAQDLSATEQAYLQTLESELAGKLMNNPLSLNFTMSGAAEYKTRQITAKDAPGGAAFQIRVRRAGQNPGDATVEMGVDRGVAMGDEVTVAFWANAPKPPKGEEAGYLTSRIQKKTEPDMAVVEQGFEIQKGWMLYEMRGVSAETLSSDAINLVFRLGDRKQSIEFGQVYVVNHGTK